jgi:hypothetical protein
MQIRTSAAATRSTQLLQRCASLTVAHTVISTQRPGAAMQNGPRRPNPTRQQRPPGAFNRPQQQRWSPNNQRPQQQRNGQSAQRNYERYMELARAEALAGNTVGAENYYQHAEHYFRTMNAGQEGT